MNTGKRQSWERSITKHRAIRPKMACITAEAPSGDQAEGFLPKSLRHFRHQSAQLQPGRIRMIAEFWAQKQGTAESWQVVGGHMEILILNPLPVAKGAIDRCIMIRTPGLEHGSRNGENDFLHVLFPLTDVHVCPIHPGAIGSALFHRFLVTANQVRRQQQNDDEQAIVACKPFLKGKFIPLTCIHKHLVQCGYGKCHRPETNPEHTPSFQGQPSLQRWSRSFEQILLVIKWNLYLVSGCQFHRWQHHGMASQGVCFCIPECALAQLHQSRYPRIDWLASQT